MRHVFQTAGDPPSIGRTIFANNGSIQKSRNALLSVVSAKRANIGWPVSRPYIARQAAQLQTQTVRIPATLATGSHLLHGIGKERRLFLLPVHPVPDLAGLNRPTDEELDLFGITHKGHVRNENQDHYLISTVHPQVVIHDTSLPSTDQLPLRGTRLATVLVLADGVGGTAAGNEAAQIATESVIRYVSSTLRSYHIAGRASDDRLLDALKGAAMEAHETVKAEAALRSDHRKMATTLTVGIVIWPWAYFVQVGDSRAYVYTDGKLGQITRDQTVAQALVDQGVIPADRLESSPLKHVLSSAIGAEDAVPEVSRVDMSERGALILLCSDGLMKHVPDDEIAAAIAGMKSSEQLSKQLMELCLERGGKDNITIIAARAPLKKA